MILELLALAWAAALCTAAVLAALPPRATEVRPSQTSRRRAVWLSVGAALAALPLLLAVAASLPIGGPPNPLGILAFVLLCGVGVIAWVVLRSAWARARSTKRSEDLAAAARLAAPGEGSLPPQPHRGLSGAETPPTRW